MSKIILDIIAARYTNVVKKRPVEKSTGLFNLEVLTATIVILT